MPPLPPGQQLVAPAKWPLVGERQAQSVLDPWTVELTGLVDPPQRWTVEELCQLPVTDAIIDVHCVTRWSKLAVPFRGVLLASLLEQTRVASQAQYVSFVAHSPRGHSTSLRLEDALQLGTMLALEADGRPLAAEHGGPVRIVTPGRYFYKSLKWLRRIELLAEDRLGYWEATAGYHNHADPLREERYLAPTLSKQQAAAVIAARDFCGLDLRSLQADRRDLAGLQARSALLRDADFRHAHLRGACFDEANLSNAHFEHAQLVGASFVGADLEGANFEGADLRGADLRNASLLGVTFVAPDSAGTDAASAQLDDTTLFSRAALEQLAPRQVRYLRATGLAMFYDESM